MLLYDGQRRLLAAKASHELAGTDGFEGLAPVRTPDRRCCSTTSPAPDEISRIQAQANQREELSLVDQQQQFADCWHARAGLRRGRPDRSPSAPTSASPPSAPTTCAASSPSPSRSANASPSARPASSSRSRWPTASPTCTTIAPELTQAVAKRITSTDLHDSALRDLGAFVHRTIVEDEHTYAVRIDDGAMLDAAEQIERARAHLTATERRTARPHPRLRARTSSTASSTRSPPAPRPRRSSSRSPPRPATAPAPDASPTSTSADRTSPTASGSSTPLFMHRPRPRATRQPRRTTSPPERRRSSPAPRLDDDELRTAGQEDRERRNAQRLRQAEATNSNLGLGHDLRAGLMDPTPGQLHALKAIICHLLARHYRDVIAYGAGWTDQDRQQPIGDTGRHEPRQPDAILDAELERALDDPDPLRGIAQLTASWAAAFALDPDGVTRTKTLGTDRMARKLADALPGGHSPLRAAVWEFLRPMLSPRLADPSPRHVRVRRATGDHRRARRPPRGVEPRRARPGRPARRRGRVTRPRFAPSLPRHRTLAREGAAAEPSLFAPKSVQHDR